MKSVQDAKKYQENINSACSVVNLQSNSPKTVHEPIRDSDLIIDINSDVESYDRCEFDDQKSNLSNEYNFEQDIEKLIEVSKQFQKDYENGIVKNRCSVEVDDPNKKISIQITSSNASMGRLTPTFRANQQPNDVDNYYFSNYSSASRSKKENIFSLRSNQQRNKTFAPKLPNPGPFGTGIIRQSPKKHSCVQKDEVTPVRRSCSVRPYSIRYYNFDRTHPHLELVENGDSIIPKRILKNTKQMTDKVTTKATTKKQLLNKGLTWHEFFERGNVYSAKSLQSSHGYGPIRSTATQTIVSEPEPLTPKVQEFNKIQKHILPQLNIRAECCVQRIPEISIAPTKIKHTVKSNIKLVEIIYEESDGEVKVIESPVKESIVSTMAVDKSKIIEHQQYQSDSEYTAEEIEVNNETTQISESKISFSTSSKTSSNNQGYDSSLEESVSLNVSRVSALTDQETPRRLLPADCVPIQKLKRYGKHRKDTNNQHVTTSSSDCRDFQYDGNTFFLLLQKVFQSNFCGGSFNF